MYCDNLPKLDGCIFDTHAHYDDSAFDEDRAALLNEIHSYGVCGIINCAYNKASVESTLALTCEYPFFYAAIGLHPEEDEPLDIDFFRQKAQDPRCVAIGEIGLDYHWDSVPRDIQKENFTAQIALANELNLPVIVHDREAHSDTLEILKKTNPKGVMHCFSGSAETAKEVVKMGMYLGFGGALTFKNARRAVEAAEVTPIERILLETDAPYMSPVPLRGKRCNSAMIYYVAERIAQIKCMTIQDVLSATRNNVKELFGV